MTKLIIMQGLPASGKSTLAKELAKTNGAIRINKDLLRTMLHFDRFTGKNEEMTRHADRLLAREFLLDGKNVIIDDTNLNPKTVQGWVDLAKETQGTRIEYQRLDTPVEVCVARDASRETPVGPHIIIGMALQWGLYPKPNKGVVLCDLDGTLCDITHRLHHVQKEPKDWKAFFEGIPHDTVRPEVQDMVLEAEGNGYEIFFISARPDTYRGATEVWLERAFNGYQPYKALFMREAYDRRPDTEVKADMFDRYFKDMPIEAIIDDRPSVIRMWRERGLPVIDVGAGVEF